MYQPSREIRSTATPAATPASAYEVLEEGVYRSSLLTRGPWSPEHQHAGPPTALVCRAIERCALEKGLTHVCRLTANLLRPVPVGDLVVEVAVDYVGRNAGHFRRAVIAAGKEVARFTALVQREIDVPIPERLPGHPLNIAPCPPDESPIGVFPFASRHVGYADLVETRVAQGRLFDGPCIVWFRPAPPLAGRRIAQRLPARRGCC